MKYNLVKRHNKLYLFVIPLILNELRFMKTLILFFQIIILTYDLSSNAFQLSVLKMVISQGERKHASCF